MAKKPGLPAQDIGKAEQKRPVVKQNRPALSRYNYAWLLAVIIAILSFGIYANSIKNEYNIDDELIIANHALQQTDFSKMKKFDFKQFKNLFSQPYYSDEAGNRYEYRPVVMASFFIEFWHSGKKPAMTKMETEKSAELSHSINVWIYVVTCVLIFYLLQALFRDNPHRFNLAFAITLLFVVHPLHTEAVASIKSRDELLSMLFGVSAWIFALKFAGEKSFVSVVHFLLCLLFFVGAIFSKQTTIAFSLLIPVSVALFRKENFWYYLLLLLPIVFIANYFAPIYLLFVKIGVAAASILFLIGFYLFMCKRGEVVRVAKTVAAGTKNFFTTKVNYKWVGGIAGLVAVLFLSVFIAARVNDKVAQEVKQIGFAITDPINDFNETQLTPLLNQPAPSIIPIAGRKLNYAETPLTFEKSLNKKIGTSFYALGFYLRLMFVPYPLSFYYGYNQIPLTGVGNVFVLFSLLVHIGIFAGALYLLYKRKHPVAAFGLLFYLLAMIPLSNLITPIAGVVAERLAYSASLGFCIALGYLLFYPAVTGNSPLVKQLGKNAVFVSGAVFLVIVVVFSIFTIDRNRDWKNHFTLFEADIEHLDNSARAHALYGSHLATSTMHDPKSPESVKKLQQAAKHFRRATEIYPDFAHAWDALGKTYIKLGDFNGAIEAYTRATQTDTINATSFFELGIVLDEAKRYKEAEAAYLKTIRMDSTFIHAYINLSHTYHVQGRANESIAINLLALKRNPTNPQTYDVLSNLGKTYLGMQDYDSALFYFEKAIALSRSQKKMLDKKMLEVVAGLYQRKGDFAKAQFYMNLR